jgi:hypothetical protein
LWDEGLCRITKRCRVFIIFFWWQSLGLNLFLVTWVAII